MKENIDQSVHATCKSSCQMPAARELFSACWLSLATATFYAHHVDEGMATHSPFTSWLLQVAGAGHETCLAF